MKILKRTKGLLRFKVSTGTITLKEGENELSDAESKLIKEHPMYEALVKTSGLVEVAEAPKPKAKTAAQIKAEKKAAKKAEEEKLAAEEAANADSEGEEDESKEDSDSEGEEGIDLSDIDLKKQDKKALVEIATALELDTKGLNADQIIKLIESKK
jgi:hypothetical protein